MNAAQKRYYAGGYRVVIDGCPCRINLPPTPHMLELLRIDPHSGPDSTAALRRMAGEATPTIATTEKLIDWKAADSFMHKGDVCVVEFERSEWKYGEGTRKWKEWDVLTCAGIVGAEEDYRGRHVEKMHFERPDGTRESVGRHHGGAVLRPTRTYRAAMAALLGQSFKSRDAVERALVQATSPELPIAA